MLAALLPSKPYFNRHASLRHEALTPGWMTSTLLVLAGVAWLGIFSHKHVEYSHALCVAVCALGRSALIVARHGGGGCRSVRGRRNPLASPLLIRRRICRTRTNWPRLPAWPPNRRARTPTGAYGRQIVVVQCESLGLFNVCHQRRQLGGLGRSRWFPREAAELAWRFRELCDRHAGWPTFYQIAAEQLPLYLDLGLSLLKLGEEAHVTLADVSHASDTAWMRSVLDQAHAEGCTFEPVAPPLEESLLSEVAEVSAEWLAAHRAKGLLAGILSSRLFTPLSLGRCAAGGASSDLPAPGPRPASKSFVPT